MFDLDGTLLPMDYEEFTKAYFGLLSRKFHEYDPQALIAAVWKGTKAMMTNDGSALNEQRFWDVFAGIVGEEVRARIPEFDDFYRTDFHQVKAVCGDNPMAKALVDLAHKRADLVILATNPLFPPCAVESRLSWIGLTPEDFDYITTYDNSTCCKPSKAYYESICRIHNLNPADCLMIGNDLKEDGFGAGQIGMPVHILTDSLIEHGLCLNDFPHSTFAQLLETL